MRNQILKNETTAEDPHVTHCLGRLRRVLMCNADLALTVTEDYDDFDMADTHTRHDFEAVVNWVKDNKWEIT